MSRFLLSGAVLMIGAWPLAAAAQSDTVLDCAVDRVDPGLKRSLASAMMGEGDDAAFDAMLARFSVVADDCTVGLALTDTQKKTYVDYGIARIVREWMVGELAGYGLSASTIDDALEFGAGRRNPAMAGEMGEDQVKALVQAFIESGIDAEGLGAPAWNAVGTYAAASSIYWRRRQLLSVSVIGSAPRPPIVVPTPVVAPVSPPATAVPPDAPSVPAVPAVAAPMPEVTAPAAPPEPAPVAAPTPAPAQAAPVPLDYHPVPVDLETPAVPAEPAGPSPAPPAAVEGEAAPPPSAEDASPDGENPPGAHQKLARAVIRISRPASGT